MNMPATHIANASSPVSLCAWYLARALTEARAIKASADALAKVQEHLAAARRHYCTAKARGASADVLAQLAADGVVVAAEVKAAAERVAERAAVKAAEAVKKVRRARAMQLKGLYTGEAARFVAHAMAAKGLAVDAPAAMGMIAAETQKVVTLGNTSPDHILNAWMVLDPA